MRKLHILMAAGIVGTLAAATNAGTIVLTGHDPDFHASLGGNREGAQHLNQTFISFIMDAANNPFVAAGHNKFLYVDSSIVAPPGHTKGVNGIEASGFKLGTNFDVADASTLTTKLGSLGSTYGGLVVASDFGGTLTQAELNILNAHSANIIKFLNAGGGLYAMAESNANAHLTPKGGQFGFLPFVVSSTQLTQAEVGNTLTRFGSGLGLSVSDINGNASHNIFNGQFGLNVVDHDATGHILTLAGQGQIGNGGINGGGGTGGGGTGGGSGGSAPGTPPVGASVPEPATLALLPIALTGLALRRRRQR